MAPRSLTQEWGRRPGAEATVAPPALDAWRVSELHADIHAAEIGWQSVLRASGKVVLDITYDDIAADLASVVGTVASFADVGLRSAFDVVPTYVRQADDATDRFTKQWQVTTGGCSACASNQLQL